MTMLDLKQLLIDMTRSIVDKPDEITVTETENGDNVLYVISVAEDDMGKVIGRHGKNAKAIRSIMKTAANTIGKRVTVDIK